MKTDEMKLSSRETGEKLYDLELIEKMCRGSLDLVKEMLNVFIEDLPHAVNEIKSAYQARDFKTIKAVAHRVKPVLNFYAVQSLVHHIPNMEALAEQEDGGEEMQQMINKMEAVIAVIVEDMRNTVLAK